MPEPTPPTQDAYPLTVTPDDIRWIRERRKQEEHEAWLRGQIRVLWPWVVAVIGGLVAVVTWVKDHVKF